MRNKVNPAAFLRSLESSATAIIRPGAAADVAELRRSLQARRRRRVHKGTRHASFVECRHAPRDIWARHCLKSNPPGSCQMAGVFAPPPDSVGVHHLSRGEPLWPPLGRSTPPPLRGRHLLGVRSKCPPVLAVPRFVSAQSTTETGEEGSEALSDAFSPLAHRLSGVRSNGEFCSPPNGTGESCPRRRFSLSGGPPSLLPQCSVRHSRQLPSLYCCC